MQKQRKKLKKYSLNDRLEYYDNKLVNEDKKGKNANKNKKDFYLGYFQGVYKGKTNDVNASKSYKSGVKRGSKVREKLNDIKF